MLSCSPLHFSNDIIPEPIGGAHRDSREMGSTLKSYLLRYFRELRSLSSEALLNARYEKFRKLGRFLEPETPLLPISRKS